MRYNKQTRALDSTVLIKESVFKKLFIVMLKMRNKLKSCQQHSLEKLVEHHELNRVDLSDLAQSEETEVRNAKERHEELERIERFKYGGL